MTINTEIHGRAFAVLTLALLVVAVDSTESCSASKVSIEGKVVLANVDRYPADYRVGSLRKRIAPKKASLLSPKRYPIVIEIWNGNRTNGVWKKQSIATAGVYTFRYQAGSWRLTKHERRQTVRRAPRYRYARPSYRRSTGTVQRVVRGSGRVYRGGHVPLLRRVAGDVLWLYRFVRDEEDRNLLRDIVVGREIDREVERDLRGRLDDIAVNLPAGDRREFERALDDITKLSDKDLRDLENATDTEWDELKDILGDQVTDNAWRELESDFGDIDVDDLSMQEIEDLGDAGIDSLDSDLDIGDLDGGDLDIGNLDGTLDEIDIGGLGGGIEDIDIGDVGGGFDDLGGDGGFDNDDFDYDTGGFDDYGGGYDDFGGGFDDFGGGFDDF